ncbi:MAG: hypothetical protein IJZ93_03325 [Clostridia bacterium]|nr:hypothetical protein [Clostridia bacterium]
MNCFIYSLFLVWEWEIHFGSLKIFLPWWIIAIPSALLIVIPILIISRLYSKKKFVCPNCNESFYPRMRSSLFIIHMNDDVYLKCPYCKKRSMCHPSYRQTEEKK